MNRSTSCSMLKTTVALVALFISALFSCVCLAELDLAIAKDDSQQVHGPLTADPFSIDFQRHAGTIHRYKMTRGLRVRGWEMADRVYFGQARVGKKWGVGVIVDRGQYVYGINNRGIQVLRRH